MNKKAQRLLELIASNHSENPREDAYEALKILLWSDTLKEDNDRTLTVGQLRKALEGLPDDMEVLGRAFEEGVKGDDDVEVIGGLTVAKVEPDHLGELSDVFMLQIDYHAKSAAD